MPTEFNNFELTLVLEGIANLKDILDKANLADTISAEFGWFEWKYLLTSVYDEAQLHDFLKLLDSTVIIDIDPLQECYAMAPYSVFDDEGNAVKTPAGNLLNQAKYWRNKRVVPKLGEFLDEFVARHPRLRDAQAIVAPPSSDNSTPDLAGQWPTQIAKGRALDLLHAVKLKETEPQKLLTEGVEEEDVAAQVANSIGVEQLPPDIDIIVVDDTIRSGGTMKEMGRALIDAGAHAVFGLSLAKDAKFTKGGVDLSQETWQ